MISQSNLKRVGYWCLKHNRYVTSGSNADCPVVRLYIDTTDKPVRLDETSAWR